jgi:hypothetical protein
MRRLWPIYVGVVVLSVGAGAAIAGRPQSVPELVIDPSSVTTSTVGESSAPTSAAP